MGAGIVWALFLLGLWSTDAKTVTGVIETEGTQWSYLAKFVFRRATESDLNTSITIQAHDFNGSTVGAGQEILLYHDVDAITGFQGVFDSSRSCLYKNSKKIRSVKIADLPKYDPTNSTSSDGVVEPLWQPAQQIPRWWYVAIAHCSPQRLHYYQSVSTQREVVCKLDHPIKNLTDIPLASVCEDNCNGIDDCHSFSYFSKTMMCILYPKSLFETDLKPGESQDDYVTPQEGGQCRTWDRAASQSFFGEKKIFYGLHAAYTITFKNGNDKFRGHFSADETGIFEACIVFFVILFGLSALYGKSFFVISKQDGGNMARNILLISGSAVVIHLFSMILALAHFDAYSNDGIGLPSLMVFVIYLEQVPELLVITLLLLISKGTFISSTEIQSTRGLLEVIVVYTGVVIAMLSWAQLAVNDLKDAYYLETPFGVVLLVGRFLVLFIFVTTSYQTFSKEINTVKKRFYTMFGIFGFLFFLTMPVAYTIASTVYDYHRKKTDFICQHTFDILGYIIIWLFFGTGKGGYVRTESDAVKGGHAAISTHDDGETQI